MDAEGRGGTRMDTQMGYHGRATAGHGATTDPQVGPATSQSVPDGSSVGIVVSMLDAQQQQALVTRLNRIEGQVRGIRRMVQEPRLCVEILQQLAAAEAALNRVSLAILKYHVEHCVPEGVNISPEEGSMRLKELVDIFDRFSS